jgi:hypothetical protein
MMPTFALLVALWVLPIGTGKKAVVVLPDMVPQPGDIRPLSTPWVQRDHTDCQYKLVSRPKLGWAAARDSCAQIVSGEIKAELASVTDEDELAFTERLGGTPPWWLGGFVSTPPQFPPPCPKNGAAMALAGNCVVLVDRLMWRWADGSFFDQVRATLVLSSSENEYLTIFDSPAAAKMTYNDNCTPTEDLHRLYKFV